MSNYKFMVVTDLLRIITQNRSKLFTLNVGSVVQMQSIVIMLVHL